MNENGVTHDIAMKIMQIELGGNGYCKKYNRSIIRAQGHFLSWITERGITTLGVVTKRDIYNYQKELLSIISEQTGKPLARGTLSDRYNAVKILFSALCRAGLLKENVTSGVKFELPKTEGLKRQAFTDGAMSEILEKMDINTEIGLRDRALFELIYSSGLRVLEASRLTIKDISLERREMVVRGKFARDRVVPISKVARDYLALYMGNRVYNKDEPVFCGVYGKAAKRPLHPDSIGRRFTDLLRKYDMKKKELSAHSIRHTSASQLLDSGAGIRHVQELLGHKNLETTALYTHARDERLAKIYRKYHPQEHDLFEAADEGYKKRLAFTLGANI
jgi:site-specific recombinase XerD